MSCDLLTVLNEAQNDFLAYVIRGFVMIKKLLAIGALAVAFPAQAAVTISYTGGASPLPAGLTIIEDFESFAPGASIGGTNAFAYNTDIGGIAARPAFNTTTGNYAAVRGDPTGSYTNMFAAPVSIFSFVLGSLDSYNELTLFFAGGGSQIFSGSAINNGPVADGDQVGSGTNGRVTYTVIGSDPLITGAKFRSIGQNSFEFDKLATGAVPEPSTWLMMMLGMLGVGFSLRRKKQPALRVRFA